VGERPVIGSEWLSAPSAIRAINVASNIPLRSGDRSGGFVMAVDLRHRHADRPGARPANGGATIGGRMWVSVR
jgi:hypothetical protein